MCGSDTVKCCAFNNIDMAAASFITSLGLARELGIDDSKLVYVHGTASYCWVNLNLLHLTPPWLLLAIIGCAGFTCCASSGLRQAFQLGKRERISILTPVVHRLWL